VTAINPGDEAWFLKHRVRISLEGLGDGRPGENIAVYADIGLRLDDDPNEEPEVLLVISRGATCEDTMAHLRKKCEERMAKDKRPLFFEVEPER
jgi:hypothetical protein